MRRFWSLFLVGLPACSGMATSPAQFRGDAAVARMRAAYSSVQAYEDKGVVTVLDGAGPKPGISQSERSGLAQRNPGAMAGARRWMEWNP